MKLLLVVAGVLLALCMSPVAQADQLGEYVESTGVSASEAARQLDTQNRAGDIVTKLRDALGDKYAGVWFDDKDGRFKVPAISGQEARTQRLNLGVPFDVVAADRTYAQLEAERDADIERVKPWLKKREASIGIGKGRVEITATSDVAGAVRKAAVAAVTKEVSRPSIGQPMCYAWPNCDRPLRAGVAIWYYGVGDVCTGGFIATWAYYPYYRFMLTAGHCLQYFPQGGPWWYACNRNYCNGTDGGLRIIGPNNSAGYMGPNGDYAQILVQGNSYWLPIGSAGYSTWPGGTFTPVRSSRWSYPGVQLCRSGAGANSTDCGVVRNNGVTYCPSVCVGNMTLADDMCGHPGDSGGPIMSGDGRGGGIAWGILSGGTTWCGPTAWIYFNEVKRIEQAYSVYIATGTI